MPMAWLYENTKTEQRADECVGWAGDIHPAACPPEMLALLAQNGKKISEKYPRKPIDINLDAIYKQA